MGAGQVMLQDEVSWKEVSLGYWTEHSNKVACQFTLSMHR